MTTRPTGVRHRVVGVTTLMAVLLYLDRNALGLIVPFIRDDVGLSDMAIGWAMSAFYLSYALGQVPSGWLTDRFGARLMLTWYILIWSLFTGLMGVAAGLVSLVIFRLGMGLGQAGAYPTGANIVSKWAPFAGRGKSNALVSFGGRAGGFLAPVLTSYLILAFTPLSVSSFLDRADLLDIPRLCFLLTTPEQASDSQANTAPGARHVAERVFLLLGPQRPAVTALAAEHQRARERRKQQEPDGAITAGPLMPAPASFDQEQFLAKLNSIIRQRHSLSYVDLEGLPLEKEAARLRERNPENLSQPQAERLNRLILEAAFPGSIRRVYSAAWRRVLLLYAFAGVAVAAAFWVVARDRPSDHPRVNEAELELVRFRPKEATATEGTARRLPLENMLRSRSLWLSCISQFTTNFGWMFLVTWLPTYLERRHSVPVETRGWLILAILLIGAVGMLLGGALTDRLAATIGIRWGRALPMGLTRFLAMAAYLLLLREPSLWAAVAAFAVVSLATDLGVSAVWSFCQDVGGAYAGSILGWGNMWGNFGALIAPPLFIAILGQSQAWDRVFLVCAAMFFISGVAALGIDATRPVAPEEK
jgi:nitrate/nitrite transporter NarK